MKDKTKIILRNDPAKKRRKLGKVKDLVNGDINGMSFDMWASDYIEKRGK